MSELRAFARRWRDERAMTRALRRDLSVPPAEQFAAFGARSHLDSPTRVTNPHRIHLGDDVWIGAWCWLAAFDHDGVPASLTIGSRVRIGRFVKLACLGQITLGDDVHLGDSVYVADSEHGHDDPMAPIARQPMTRPEPVHIGAGTVVGNLARILPGTTIGADAIVAPAAVVRTDVPDGAIAIGNPASVVDRSSVTWL